LHAVVAVGWLQPANSYNCKQLIPKTVGVVPPDDGFLTPETCRGLRDNKVIVKGKEYQVGYVIVILPFNAGIKSLRATLIDEIFTGDFAF
jgi:hypothetical protein